MGEQVTQFCRRLRLPEAVSNQAMEYYRLAELKCPRGAMSSSCIAVICIELASAKLGEPFDKKESQKLSGLRPKAYLSSFETVKKQLGIASRVDARELGVKLGCLAAVELAEEVLRKYKGEFLQKKYSAAQREGLDLEKPLYPAAALYCSCKALKIGCDKSKFQSSSMSSRSMFLKVLEEMTQCVPSKTDDFGRGKKRGAAEDLADQEEEDMEEGEGLSRPPKTPRQEPLHSRILSDPTSASYLQWKERTIRQAELELGIIPS